VTAEPSAFVAAERTRSVWPAALAQAHVCGATVVERSAREHLREAGARPRRPALSGRDSLTPTELQVARLAADGLKNREIAERQVVTVKTVEQHLNRAYAKLGIAGRHGLQAALD
jgi:DNA-binding NarL/FixJ family response regulator